MGFFFTCPYWDIGSDSSPYLVVQGESVFKVTFTYTAKTRVLIQGLGGPSSLLTIKPIHDST